MSDPSKAKPNIGALESEFLRSAEELASDLEISKLEAHNRARRTIDRAKAIFRRKQSLEESEAEGLARQLASEIALDDTALAEADHIKVASPPDDYAELIGDWYAHGTACASDDKAQIEWLKDHATPELLHESTLYWNLDHGHRVLEWILADPRTSRASVAYLLAIYLGNSDPEFESDHQAELMKTVAKRLREGFYSEQFGLPQHRNLTRRDLQLMEAKVEQRPNRIDWHVEERWFKGFSETQPHRGEYIFDDGQFRVSLDNFQKIKRS